MPSWRRTRARAEKDQAAAQAQPLTPESGETSPDSETRVLAAYLSPNHEYLAVLTDTPQLTFYEFDGERIGRKLAIERPAYPLPRMEWLKSGTTLAFVNRSNDAEIIDIHNGESSNLGHASAVAVYPDGSRIVVRDGSRLKIYEVGSLELIQAVGINAETKRESTIATLESTLAISPDSRLIAWGTEFSTVQVLDAGSLNFVSEFSSHSATVIDLQWIGPHTLASGSFDQTIRVWDPLSQVEHRVLEIERNVAGLAYLPTMNYLIGWTRHKYLFWDISNGALQQNTLPLLENSFGYRFVSASPDGSLIATLTGPNIEDIRFSRAWDADRDRPDDSVSTYANAKVLMLGDSGVGKSGLALVLAGEGFQPTDSTHGRHICEMPTSGASGISEAQREVLLWDLAGQPGYRIVHQLHLSDGAVALILFDSRSETNPLAGVGYWARALQHAQTAGTEGMPTFLVGARTDRGTVGVSDERIEDVVAEFGFREYLATSAKEGWGITELHATVLAAIDWTRIPVVTSSALFAAAKSFVLDQKAAGILLTPLASLLASFLGAPVTGPAARAVPDAKSGRDLLDAEPMDGHDRDRLRGVFEGCVARLESAGLVKRLAFGDLVLLQPELIDVYAGAIVNAARDEPDGLGSMLESRVLKVDFRLPEQERIIDRQQERLLVIATVEELTRHEIVLREETEEGVQLIFPAAFRRDLPEAGPPENAVEFTFEGPVVNIYVTLVVRLARSDRFTRRGAFQAAAQFEADAGGICTVHLTRSDEGRGALQVGHSGAVTDVVRFQFERFVRTHLERRATSGTVSMVRLYRCLDCGSPFSIRQVEAAIGRGRTSLVCPVDETRTPLEGSYETLSQAQDEVAKQMDASADAARGIAAASSIILGKKEMTDFDVFLCHNGDDKPDVRWTAEQLRQRGILPWLDEDELIPGRPWQEELEQQISRIRAVAVFIGPSGIGPWQNQEMRAFLSEFVERGCPVIPVILPGAAIPTLPVFLRPMTWVDFRTSDPAGIERLIWGITGRKPGLSDLDEGLE